MTAVGHPCIPGLPPPNRLVNWLLVRLVVAALLFSTGCAAWKGGERELGAMSPPSRSSFRRNGGGGSHYFFDSKAREIEASLGVGGPPAPSESTSDRRR